MSQVYESPRYTYVNSIRPRIDLFLNSEYRDNTYHTSSYSRFNINKAIDNCQTTQVLTLNLHSVWLYNTFMNISPNKNAFVLVLDSVIPTSHNIVLTIGHYNASQLATEITTKLNAFASGFAFSVVYNDFQKSFTFNRSGTTEDIGFHFEFALVNGKQSNIMKLMGFKSTVTANSIHNGANWVLFSEVPLNFQLHRYCIVKTNLSNQNSYNSVNKNVDSILGIIPLSEEFNTQTSYYDIVNPLKILFTANRLDNVDIFLVDEHNEPLVSMREDIFNIVLSIEFLERKLIC